MFAGVDVMGEKRREEVDDDNKRSAGRLSRCVYICEYIKRRLRKRREGREVDVCVM